MIKLLEVTYRYRNIGRIAIGQGENYTTCCLPYLSKQKVLDNDPKAKQQSFIKRNSKRN